MNDIAVVICGFTIFIRDKRNSLLPILFVNVDNMHIRTLSCKQN